MLREEDEIKSFSVFLFSVRINLMPGICFVLAYTICEMSEIDLEDTDDELFMNDCSSNCFVN